MSRQAVAQAIYEQLAADQSADSLWSALSGRIYHLQAPSNVGSPSLTVRVDRDEPQAFFDGSSDLRATVEIEIRADNVATLLSAGDLLFERLQHQRLTMNGFRDARMRALDRGHTTAGRDALKSTSRWMLTATAR